MMQELNYIRCGDYYIPDIRLPEETRPIGRWGRMHRDYIKEHNDALYDDRIDEHMERVTAEEEKAANSKNGHADEPEFQADTENELLQRAIAMAVESGQMSISMLRRRLGLGHSRAGKLIDTMANMGIVSQDEGPKPRRTLITREDYLKMQSQIMDE